MTQYSENDPVWLVKSAGSIVGPFSMAELGKAMRDRRVALLDEARTPTTRWGFIRENPQLAELVRLIREAESRSNQTTGKTKVEGDTGEHDSEATQSSSLTLRVIETTPADDAPEFDSDLTQHITIPTQKAPPPAVKIGVQKIQARNESTDSSDIFGNG